MHLEPADVLGVGGVGGALEEGGKPPASAEVAGLRARRELAGVHVLDHALAQRTIRKCRHRKLLFD
jgi:hypothetical protein